MRTIYNVFNYCLARQFENFVINQLVCKLLNESWTIFLINYLIWVIFLKNYLLKYFIIFENVFMFSVTGFETFVFCATLWRLID